MAMEKTTLENQLKKQGFVYAFTFGEALRIYKKSMKRIGLKDEKIVIEYEVI